MSKNMWDRIERAHAGHKVLEHPFCQRWSVGELTDDASEEAFKANLRLLDGVRPS